MTETWQTIPGFTRYQASTRGRIRSIGYNGRKSIILKQRPNPRTKYLQVFVRYDQRGRQVTQRVNVLVLLTFTGPRPDGMVARHKDDVKNHNNIENLCWGTPSQNSLDIVRNGNHPNANVTHCPKGHPYAGENLYRAPSGRGGRQCSTCHLERSRQHAENTTHCKHGHEYPAEIQQRINTRQKRRYCPTCIANRKPRKDRIGRTAA